MLLLRRWSGATLTSKLHATDDPTFPVSDPFLGSLPHMLNRLVVDDDCSPEQVRLGIQSSGSDRVNAIESALNSGKAVDWNTEPPGAIASVLVRGVRAMPKQARVFSNDRTFRHLRKAMHSDQPTSSVYTVICDLPPKRRELLQAVCGTYAAIAAHSREGGKASSSVELVVNALGIEVLRDEMLGTPEDDVLRRAMILMSTHYLVLFARPGFEQDDTVAVE